jgi:hypothetical protein
MPLYTKKPIEIEAELLTEDNINIMVEWCGGIVDINDLTAERSLSIYTLEGIMRANVGDWIIKGVKGEFYPCRADIFEATYESSEEICDPYHVEVLDVIDQEDGSAIISFDLGPEAMKTFVGVGLLKVLTDAAKETLSSKPEEFNDKDVGC